MMFHCKKLQVEAEIQNPNKSFLLHISNRCQSFSRRSGINISIRYPSVLKALNFDQAIICRGGLPWQLYILSDVRSFYFSSTQVFVGHERRQIFQFFRQIFDRPNRKGNVLRDNVAYRERIAATTRDFPLLPQ